MAVFLGTPLGGYNASDDARRTVKIPGPYFRTLDGTSGKAGTNTAETPWWYWDYWPELMRNLILWASRR